MKIVFRIWDVIVKKVHIHRYIIITNREWNKLFNNQILNKVTIDLHWKKMVKDMPENCKPKC